MWIAVCLGGVAASHCLVSKQVIQSAPRQSCCMDKYNRWLLSDVQPTLRQGQVGKQQGSHSRTAQQEQKATLPPAVWHDEQCNRRPQSTGHKHPCDLLLAKPSLGNCHVTQSHAGRFIARLLPGLHAWTGAVMPPLDNCFCCHCSVIPSAQPPGVVRLLSGLI